MPTEPEGQTFDELVNELPAGLSLSAIASKFQNLTKSTISRRLKARGYSYKDGRVGRQQLSPKWQSADWSKTNSDLASEFGVSRQRISVLRARFAKRAE